VAAHLALFGRLGTEDQAVGFGGIHVFAHPPDQAVFELEYKAIVVVVGVAVRELGTQAVFDDDDVAVGVEAAKLCGEVGNEKLAHLGCEHAGDLVPADDVPRPI
jgi:hypothetical protein